MADAKAEPITRPVKTYSLGDIAECGTPMPPDSKALMVVDVMPPKLFFVDPQNPEKVKRALAPGEKLLPPTLTQYNDYFVKKLEDEKYKSICRIDDPSGEPMLLASKTAPKPEEIFGSCIEQNAALSKKQLPMKMTPAVAKYVASRFPSSSGTVYGCSSVKEDGTVYYMLLPDKEALKIAYDAMWDDSKANGGKGNFPPGVDWATVKPIADFLLKLTEQDPYEAMKDQKKAMNDNVNKQLYVTVAMQTISTLIMSVFFGAQLLMSKKILAQNQDMMAEKFGNKSALETYGKDLVVEAKEGNLEPANMDIRAKELRKAALALARRKSVAILGRSGVGKTAFVEGLAKMVAEGLIPSLKGAKIFVVEMADVVAGTSYRGQFEQRIRAIVKDSAARIAKGEKVFVFFDEFHTMMGAGGTTDNLMDASNILKPALARRQLVVIGATTTEEVRFIKKDKAMWRRFLEVDLQEFDVEQTKKAVMTQAERIGAAIDGECPKLTIDERAVARIVELGPQFAPDTAYPANAIELLEQAAAFKRDVDPDAHELTVEDVDKAFEELRNKNAAEPAGAAAVGSEAESARSEPDSVREAFERDVLNARRRIVINQMLAEGGGLQDPNLVERAYKYVDRWMALPEETRKRIVTEAINAGEFVNDGRMLIPSKTLEEWKAQDDASKGSGRGPGDPPPAGATAGGPAGATGAAGVPGSSSARDANSEPTIRPWIDMPAGLVQTGVPVEGGFGARIVWDSVKAQAQSMIPERPAVAVGANGCFYSVGLDTATESPVVNVSTRPPIQQLPPELRDQLGIYAGEGLEAFAHLGVAGAAGGAAALTLIHAYEDSHGGKRLPWHINLGIFAGTGVAISAGLAALTNQSVLLTMNPTSLAGGFIVSGPASMASFGAAAQYGDMVGFKKGTRANEWFTVGAGSFLVAGAMTAKLPVLGTSAAALGLCGKAALAGGVAGLAVGAAAVAGGLIGRGIDKGLGAAGLKSSDGDHSFSGWVSEKIYKGTHGDDYAPIRVKLKNPIR